LTEVQPRKFLLIVADWTQRSSLRTMTQIKKTTETMGIELMGFGFLVLNKAQTVHTLGGTV